ncbi:MAG: exo-alpha-sialidase [Elusimicrobiota bacterium]
MKTFWKVIVLNVLFLGLNNEQLICETWVSSNEPFFIQQQGIFRKSIQVSQNELVRDDRIPLGWTIDQSISNHDATTNTESQTQAGRMVYDGSGTIHATYWDDINQPWDVLYTRSRDNGKTWSTANIISFKIGKYTDTSYEFKYYNGYLHLLTSDIENGVNQVFYLNSKDGDEWSQRRNMSNSNTNTGYMNMIEYDNHLFVIYLDSPTGSYQIYVTSSADNGFTWNEPIVLSTSCANLVNWSNEVVKIKSLVCDNKLYVFWDDFRNNTSNIIYKFYDSKTNNMSSDILITTNTSFYMRNKLAGVIDYKNNLVVFVNSNKNYADNKIYPREIYCLKSEDGLSWSDFIQITVKDGYISEFFFQPDRNDKGIQLGITDYRNDNYYQVYFTSSADVINWPEPKRITYHNVYAGFNSILTVGDVIHIMWFDTNNTTDNVYYKKYDPSSPTGKPSTPYLDKVYTDLRTMDFTFDRGNIYDEESRFIAFHIQIAKNTLDNLKLDVIKDAANLHGSDLEPGSTWYCRTSAMTEAGYFTEWSDWSVGAFIAQPLDNIKVYPNPVKKNSDTYHGVVFDNMNVKNCDISIYDISGELIKVLNNGGEYKITWDLTNNNYNEVASGIYIYQLKIDGKVVKTGKVAVCK